jgi:hypothetical protein
VHFTLIFERDTALHYFVLYNKHSLPYHDTENYPNNYNYFNWDYYFSVVDMNRFVGESTNKLKLNEHEVLTKNPYHGYGIVTTNHFVNVLKAPFFYQDRKHVFFVELELSQHTVNDDSLGIFTLPVTETYGLPPIEIIPEVFFVDPFVSLPNIIDIGLGDPRIFADFEDSSPLSKLIMDSNPVDYIGVPIGAFGSKHAEQFNKHNIEHSEFEWGVNPEYLP